MSAVVVGVDGSASSRAAIVLAAREARYRRAPLIAVQAYSGEQAIAGPAGRSSASASASGSGSAQRSPGDDERKHAENALRGTLRDALGDLAEGVEVRAVLGLAGRRIVETALRVNAQLIVLATRGSTSMLMGTVNQYVLRKAHCPVLMVPSGGPVAQAGR